MLYGIDNVYDIEFVAIDLVTRMLSFDPSQRITVPEALEHPWLASYHDINDEPDCPIVFEKWRDIEKLDTIDEYREALWSEIEDFRREVRSINYEFSQPLGMGIGSGPGSVYAKSVSPEAMRKEDARQSEKGDVPLPDVLVCEEADANGTESTTAVGEGFPDGHEKTGGAATPSTAITVTAQTTTATAILASTPVVTSAGGLRPSIERRDSTVPSSAEYCDPVVSYARRSSIMQAHQAAVNAAASAAASVSPAGTRSISGLPTYAEDENIPVTYAPNNNARGTSVTSGSTSTSTDTTGGTGTIPFPSTGASYIIPARSRTASMPGDHYHHGSAVFGSTLSTTGPRKLLRTLSTVSIHDPVDGRDGLAAKGAIGQAIMDGRETAADAPPSEMPREFSALKEEEEDSGSGERKSGRGSGGSGVNSTVKNGSKANVYRRWGSESGSGESGESDNHDNGKHPAAIMQDGNCTDASRLSATGTASPAGQQKKKEKRFILF